ncbi:MAG: 16S rRNA methyltransferase [bacterium]
MAVLTIVLADAEVELAPAEIAGHPAVKATARAQERKPGEVLLDQNAHGAATARLVDGKRRGRPDIVHYCLLTILESPLCKADRVRVAIHTRHGELIRIKPDTRLPRGEARFQGLIARVLREGRSQDKEPLLWSDGKRSPAQVLEAMAVGPVLRLDEGGKACSPADLAGLAKAGDLTVVLGAFPSGAFSAPWLAAAPEAVSLWPQALNAWAIAAEVVAGHRAKWGP